MKNRKFIAGELVKVISEDKIAKAVDSKNKRNNGLFMEQMWQYCGNTYKILKVVDSIFDEQHKRTLRPRSLIYILDGLICNGELNEFPSKCDRSCFLLWHEDWLEKTEQLLFTDSRLDYMPKKRAGLVGPEMCQLQLIEGIGYRNSWPNDKLQYCIRKLRWYRKMFWRTIHDVLNAGKARDLSQDKIQAGDLVRVRCKADIKRTLDGWRKTKGCTFAPLMYKECSKEHRVFKKVDYFFDEYKQKMVKCNGIVLLEGCFCNGKTAYLKTCDRTCFYFWQSSWLEKIAAESALVDNHK